MADHVVWQEDVTHSFETRVAGTYMHLCRHCGEETLFSLVEGEYPHTTSAICVCGACYQVETKVTVMEILTKE